MKQIYIGANWKMNLTLAETEQYFNTLREFCEPVKQTTIFAVVPSLYLWKARLLTENTSILVGAQNMHWEEKGAFTGEISARMLCDLGIQLVELGHSERRLYFNETDYTVNRKVLSALAHDIIPLLCVGENGTEKDYGIGEEVIARQLKIVLHDIQPWIGKPIWIAYEPIWAIGEGGAPAESEYAEKMHRFIRDKIRSMFGLEYATRIPILYGGSVNLNNCADFIVQPNIDGLFIGRCSWDVETFMEIIKRATRAVQKCSTTS